MKIILLNKYRKQSEKDWNKFLKSWVCEGIGILDKHYSYFDCTLVIGQDKGKDPIYSRGGNNLWGGVIFIDPDEAFKENYTNKKLVTIARTHMSNIKKSVLPLKQKRLMDFVLGVAHEIGHIRMNHSGLATTDLYDVDDEYRQLVENEAEREVLYLANQLQYKNQSWFDIIQPKPIEIKQNVKKVIFGI